MKIMKKYEKYEKPELEIMYFAKSDVITSSTLYEDDDEPDQKDWPF